MPYPPPETTEALLQALLPHVPSETPSLEHGLRSALLSMALHDPSRPRTLSDLLRVLLGHSWRGPVAQELCEAVRRRLEAAPDQPLEVFASAGRKRA